MPSLIEGYNYDIFISYRQKDNKGDKWVSKFVEALKTELEATFKEDISVYFDENPHDRLQETHNVDKSLEGKLKCLIFIPILSQTYCDPGSYAWQYEFLPFLRMAENDRFGRNVRLKSGNVASRILPIRIHDLEQEDIKLFEKETGSVLRAMDFVFKTAAGAIRPLLPNEDHPNDNLYKTFYRDQISKVGIAIKEIIQGIRVEPVPAVKETAAVSKEPSVEVRQEEIAEIQEKPAKTSRLMLLFGIGILAVLIVAIILSYPKIFKRDALEKLRSSGERISVAVMPFQNLTNDTIWNIYQLGIQDDLINYLTNFNEDLEVRQAELISSLLEGKGINNYASITPSVLRTISKKLNAKLFITGSIIPAGGKIRLNSRVIDSQTEETLRSFQIEGESKTADIFYLTDSLRLMIKNYLIISLMKKKASPVIQSFFGSTKSPEALRYYLDGLKAFTKREYPAATELFLLALKADPNYFNAMFYITSAYGNRLMYIEAKEWCLKASQKADVTSKIDKLWAEQHHAYYFGNPLGVLKCSRQLLEIDDQQAVVYYLIGLQYNRVCQYDKAIPEYEKALEIYQNMEIKPAWVYNYTGLGVAYHNTKNYRKEKNLYKKAEKDFPDDFELIYRQAVLALSEGKARDANDYIKRYISLREETASEADIEASLAVMYNEADLLNEAEVHYRKALSLSPERSYGRMNNLAYFLIEKDRNINEGMELIDKALKINPNSFSCLHTKGWGLYKQGKYQEALEILQKSWDLRKTNSIYDHTAFAHLDSAKNAVAGLKSN